MTATILIVEDEADLRELVRYNLEAEGFRVDIKAVPENREFPFSLHATKNMRVHAGDMKELSRRFTELAVAQHGRYDGWGSN